MSDKVKLTRPSFRDLLWLFARVLKTSPFIATVWVILVLINAGAGAAQLLVLRETVNTLVNADLISSAVPWLAAHCFLFFIDQAISTLLPLLREQLRIRAGFHSAACCLAKDRANCHWKRLTMKNRMTSSIASWLEGIRALSN